MLIVVQSGTNNPTSSENLRSSNLKPYQANINDPYVTAYLKTDVLPLLFVVGDGKNYNSDKETYFNQPLKQNSRYIVFLRFFENQVSRIKIVILFLSCIDNKVCDFFGTDAKINIAIINFIIFVQDSYYSTEWSNSVKTMTSASGTVNGFSLTYFITSKYWSLF